MSLTDANTREEAVAKVISAAHHAATTIDWVRDNRVVMKSFLSTQGRVATIPLPAYPPHRLGQICYLTRSGRIVKETLRGEERLLLGSLSLEILAAIYNQLAALTNVPVEP